LQPNSENIAAQSWSEERHLVSQKHYIPVLGLKMINTRSLPSNSATTSHQITQLMNTDILILNLMSVHQCIIGDIAKLHVEFLMIDDGC